MQLQLWPRYSKVSICLHSNVVFKKKIRLALQSNILRNHCETKLLYDPSYTSVGRSICRSVGLSVLISEKGGKWYFHVLSMDLIFFYTL